MQATDKQSFNSNPSLVPQSHTDDEKEEKEKELQANKAPKSIGSQIYERQRQRVENSQASNATGACPRPFSTLQRNPSRTNSSVNTNEQRPKVAEINSLCEEDESSMTRAQSLRNLTQKFEKMQAKNAAEIQPTNGTRPIAKRFSLLEPSVSMSAGNGLNVLDITPSKETLVEIHRKLEGML
jgi:uncharacterized coiled-coil protein SlyX